jgi:hypothetical protein
LIPRAAFFTPADARGAPQISPDGAIAGHRRAGSELEPGADKLDQPLARSNDS